MHVLTLCQNQSNGTLHLSGRAGIIAFLFLKNFKMSISLICCKELARCFYNMLLLLLTFAMTMPLGESKNITGKYLFDEFLKLTPSCLPSKCSHEALSFFIIGSVILSVFLGYLLYCCFKAWTSLNRNNSTDYPRWCSKEN